VNAQKNEKVLVNCVVNLQFNKEAKEGEREN